MGPLKSAVARRALMNLMQSNLDLLDSCIDQCYAPDPVVARAHFKASSTDFRRFCGMFYKLALALRTAMC